MIKFTHSICTGCKGLRFSQMAPTLAMTMAAMLTVSWNWRNLATESYTLRPHFTAWQGQGGVSDAATQQRRVVACPTYRHNVREVGGQQHNIGGVLADFRGLLHGEADIGLGEGRGVVGTIASHGDHLAILVDRRLDNKNHRGNSSRV